MSKIILTSICLLFVLFVCGCLIDSDGCYLFGINDPNVFGIDESVMPTKDNPWILDADLVMEVPRYDDANMVYEDGMKYIIPKGSRIYFEDSNE